MTLLSEPIAVPLAAGEPGYDVEITPESVDGEIVYVARLPELPGCMSHGSTPEDALEHLAEARAMYIEALEASGLPVPEPHKNPRTVVATLLLPGEALPDAGAPKWHVRVPGGNEMELHPGGSTRTTG